MVHRIRVSGIVRHNDQLLVINQQNYQGIRRWALPGGALEASDDNIFRGVEREMLEETGLKVQARQLRFISEYASYTQGLLALSMFIECDLAADEKSENIHLNNVQPDDNIHGVAWMSREQLQTVDIGRVLSHPTFWDKLDSPDQDVIHLGRSTE
jgi:ADP-ribose pyrophosphatase YjhB (NUDIX family)